MPCRRREGLAARGEQVLQLKGGNTARKLFVLVVMRVSSGVCAYDDNQVAAQTG